MFYILFDFCNYIANISIYPFSFRLNIIIIVFKQQRQGKNSLLYMNGLRISEYQKVGPYWLNVRSG